MDPFAELKKNVARMGSPSKTPVIDLKSEPTKPISLVSPLPRGIEVSISDLDNSDNFGGLLSYRGAQVLLFIQAHGANLSNKVATPNAGPRYHVADCSTLQKMRSQNQFQRYIATNDISGKFTLKGTIDYAECSRVVELLVCRNCLQHLNYRNYRAEERPSRTNIVRSFSLASFFSTYSTLFTELPINFELKRPETGSESNQTQLVSKSENLNCDVCKGSFPANSSLIWADSEFSEGGSVRCADCRRKPPDEETIVLTSREMGQISRARRLVRGENSAIPWDVTFQLADSIYLGLLKILKAQGYVAPEPGYELVGNGGEVVLQLGLAWPVDRIAIVINERDVRKAQDLGWKATTLSSELCAGREDGW